MKNDIDLNVQPAGIHSYSASIRAKMYSDKYRATYNGRDRARIETMRDILGIAFIAEKSYLNFRKTMAVIKLVNARIRTKDHALAVEAICLERGYKRVHTAQGLLIRMPRKALAI